MVLANPHVTVPATAHLICGLFLRTERTLYFRHNIPPVNLLGQVMALAKNHRGSGLLIRAESERELYSICL
jgi:hypothetical protein